MVGCAAVCMALAGAAFVYPYGPVDDAYIAFRYARNAADGLGVVFNPGERVEGFSSPLWVALLALGAWCGLEPPFLATVLSACCLAGIYAMLVPRKPVAALLLALHVPSTFHFLAGLETAAVALLVTGLVLVESALVRSLLAGMLVLARPEGALLVLAGCAARSLKARRIRRDEVLPALAAGGVAAVWTLFRYAYFGDVVANSARAKLVPLAVALPHGVLDVWIFVSTSLGLGLAAALAALGAWRDARSPFLLLGFALLACGGGDSYPMWRFYAPLVPILFHAAADGIEALWERNHRLSTLLTSATIVGMLVVVPSYRRDMVGIRDLVVSWVDVGRSLRRQVSPDTVVALSALGAVGYESGLGVVDMLGLTDPHTSHVPPDPTYYYPGHQRHDAAYVLDRRPDLVLLQNVPVVDRPSVDFRWDRHMHYESSIQDHPRFRTDYVLAHLPLSDGRYAKVFARADSPALEALVTMP